MAEILSSKTVKTRTSHICFGCGRRFATGTEMRRESVADGGTVFTAYLCDSCQAIQSDLDWGDEFGEGELLECALEYEAAQKDGREHDG